MYLRQFFIREKERISLPALWGALYKNAAIFDLRLEKGKPKTVACMSLLQLYNNPEKNATRDPAVDFILFGFYALNTYVLMDKTMMIRRKNRGYAGAARLRPAPGRDALDLQPAK